MKPYINFHIFLASTLIFFCSFNCYAFDISGVWQLISIEQQNKEHQWEPQCSNPSGLLIYTPSNYMAAGINCMKATNAHEPSFIAQDTTFYMGKYTVENNKILHITKNASDKAYYQKALSRNIQIINNYMIVLSLNTKNGVAVRLRWQRISN